MNRGKPERERAADVFRCRVCGKQHVGLSDDGGRTWFCREHAPADFFPLNRKRERPA